MRDRPARKGHSLTGSRVRPGRSPTFLVIGAMKAGTTSLYHYLSGHPQVFMSTPKELHFFVEEQNWARGWRWYCSQFEASGEAIAVGEASTSYTQYPIYRGVASKIAEYLPDARLIYIVRHPIDRIRSEYQHRVVAGTERAPIDQAVLTTPSYVNNSRYAMQIDQYLEHFGRDQLLVVLSERLRKDRLATMHQVARFLGIEPTWNPADLDQEFYRTEERKEFPPVLRSLRERAWIRAAARLVPRRIKEKAMRPVRKRLRIGGFTLSDPVRNQLEEDLREDVQQLVAYVGDGFEGWGIA
jgi:hypothetical protein